jgi:hypothetical protein
MLKNLIIVVSVLLISCQRQDVKTKANVNTEYGGFGCGYIHSEYGWISLFSEIDSSTYLLIQLENKHTTVESGEIVLKSDDANQVFILDFNTDKKVYGTIAEGITGYLFPCSDIVSNSHVPDTLTLVQGKLTMEIQTIVPNDERIYSVLFENAKFSKRDKTKTFKSYKCKIKFKKGEPG